MRQLYHNGIILTLEEKLYAKAVLVEDGKIKKLYYEKEELPLKENIEYIDLEGNTLMPSFMDAHSHISAFSTTMGMKDLSLCKNIKEIQEELKKFKKERTMKEWLIGFGYDHNFLQEQRHPIKEELDVVSEDVPILIAHKSGHMGIANSKALKIIGLTKDSKAPEGGKIGRDEKGNLNGYLEEVVFYQISDKIGNPSIQTKVKNYQKAESIYLSYGITTVQDGLTKKEDFELFQYLSQNHLMKVDVVSYIDLKNNADILEKAKEFEKYSHHYKVKGYKLILDGSPQGKTAWLREPYEKDKEYKGYPVYTQEELRNLVRKAIKQKKQLLVHCNGDAACEQMIKTLEELPKENLYRPVMIHAQLLGLDQLDRVKKLGIIPSFFVGHIFHWGDIHIKNLGKRAYHISPANSCLKKNILFTFHQDTPVILPNMFETLWCAVNRKTKNNIVLGEEEKIPVLEALKALTIHVAYQYQEENEKGRIKEGKIADFVIVDKNPLTIESEKIKDIKVLKTIKNGKMIYSLY